MVRGTIAHGPAAEFMPERATLEIGSIDGIPLCNGDLESEQGLPETVKKFKEQIVRAAARHACTAWVARCRLNLSQAIRFRRDRRHCRRNRKGSANRGAALLL